MIITLSNESAEGSNHSYRGKFSFLYWCISEEPQGNPVVVPPPPPVLVLVGRGRGGIQPQLEALEPLLMLLLSLQ